MTGLHLVMRVSLEYNLKLMPAKNVVKIYIENGYYHIYNRGVEKRKIFLDEQDYSVFLHFLKQYLSSPPLEGAYLTMTGLHLVRPRPIQTLEEEIDLLAFCLMPNHFHLLLQQKTTNGITKLLRRLCTSYVMYFNKKYDRIGRLFQGPYKAILINHDEYLLHLSRYLHLNPVLDKVTPCQGYRLCNTPLEYPFSSYQYYLGKKNAEWIKPKMIISFFRTAQRTSLKDILSYQSFVEDYVEEPEEILGGLTLD